MNNFHSFHIGFDCCHQQIATSTVATATITWLDGLRLVLILHHKPLGKAFEVRCLHILVHDRTPFE
ncbi:hypothetical protein Ddye_016327, partial [Dipteronia dyeriana]